MNEYTRLTDARVAAYHDAAVHCGDAKPLPRRATPRGHHDDREGAVTQEQQNTEQQGPLGFNGHRHFTMDELAALQPGLAIFMPMIGDRWWNVYYAAQAANWVMAKFELGEAITLMQKGMQTRPRYTDALNAYIEQDLAPVEAALAAEDFAAFDAAFHKATDRANEYHDEFRKGYLVWKLPDHPNPQLDFTPRG